jgi:hypothetical protein
MQTSLSASVVQRGPAGGAGRRAAVGAALPAALATAAGGANTGTAASRCSALFASLGGASGTRVQLASPTTKAVPIDRRMRSTIPGNGQRQRPGARAVECRCACGHAEDAPDRAQAAAKAVRRSSDRGLRLCSSRDSLRTLGVGSRGPCGVGSDRRQPVRIVDAATEGEHLASGRHRGSRRLRSRRSLRAPPGSGRGRGELPDDERGVAAAATKASLFLQARTTDPAAHRKRESHSRCVTILETSPWPPIGWDPLSRRTDRCRRFRASRHQCDGRAARARRQMSGIPSESACPVRRRRRTSTSPMRRSASWRSCPYLDDARRALRIGR